MASAKTARRIEFRVRMNQAPSEEQSENSSERARLMPD
jgi:hypothetical protein